MPKEKKLDLPGAVFIQLKQGAKASEKQQDILEDIASQPLFKKKAKGGLNKFMKERSGAAVTQKEADSLKKQYDTSMSGTTVTQKEADRLKKEISRSSVTGAAAEAMSSDAMKNISGAGISDAERERLQDAMPDYADGGEVVFGKGKDYIKDLL